MTTRSIWESGQKYTSGPDYSDDRMAGGGRGQNEHYTFQKENAGLIGPWPVARGKLWTCEVFEALLRCESLAQIQCVRPQ